MGNSISKRGTLAMVKIIELGSVAKKFEISDIFKTIDHLDETIEESSLKYDGLSGGNLSTTKMVFFGKNDSTKPDHSHSYLAFSWSNYIQRYIAEVLAQQKNHPLMLLRVGVFTGYYHLSCQDQNTFGNIISEELNDFEQITNICGINSIVFNQKFLRELNKIGKEVKCHNRVNDSSSNPVRTQFYELNVVSADAGLNQKIISNVRESINRRHNKRWNCTPQRVTIDIERLELPYRVLNISYDGMEVEGPVQATTGNYLKFRFKSSKVEQINQILSEMDIVAQVRWQRSNGVSYKLGLKFEDLSTEEKETIIRTIVESSY